MNLGAKITVPSDDLYYENLPVLAPEVNVNGKLNNMDQVMDILKLNKFVI